MDLVKVAVSFLTFRRFYKYLLKRVLGGVFIADFALDQLDVQLYSGEVQLTDLLINAPKLNALLNNAGIPLIIERGHVRKVHVKIPWKSILQDKCKLYVSELHLKVRALPFSFGGSCSASMSSSKSAPSSDIASLSQLVKQVVMKSEGYVERIVVDCIVGECEYRIKFSDICVCPDSSFTVNNTSLEIISPIASSAIVYVSRVGLLVELKTLKLSTDLIFVDIPNLLLCEYLFASVSLLVRPAEAMYHSVIEPASTVDRLWYEEIYSVIEAEVIKGEEVVDTDLEFVDAIESKTIDDLTLAIGEIRVRLSDPQFHSFVCRLLGISGSCFEEVAIDEYSVSIVSNRNAEPLYMSTMSEESSFESVSSSDDLAESEELFFNFGGLSSLIFSSIEEEPVRFFGENILAGSRIAVCGSDFTFHTQLVLTLSPDSLFHLQRLFAQLGSILPESAGDSADVFVINFLAGFEIQVILGNGHSISAIANTVAIDRFANISNIGIFLSGPDSGPDLAVEIEDIKVRLELGRQVAPKHIEVPIEPTDLSEWTAITGPGSKNFEHNRKPVFISPPKLLPSLVEIFSSEWVVQIDSVVFANEALVFLDLQLKIQSLFDQLRNYPSEKSALAFSGLSIVVREGVIRGGSLVLNSLAVRTVLNRAPQVLSVIVEDVSGEKKERNECDISEIVGKFAENFSYPVRVDIEINQSLTESVVSTRICLSGLQVDFDSPALWDLIQFFAPPVCLVTQAAPLITAPARPTYTSYEVQLKNCWAKIDKQGGVLVKNIELAFGLLATVDLGTPVAVDFKLGEVALWLSKNSAVCETRCISVWSTGSLRLMGFVPLVSVHNTEGSLKWQGFDFVWLEKVSVGQVRLDLKADSYMGLSHWVANLDYPKTPSFAVEEQRISLPPLTQPVSATIKFDEGWVRSKAGRGGSRFAPSPVTASTSTCRWLVDPKTLRIINDHWVDRKTNAEQKMAEIRVRESKGTLRMMSLDLRVKSVCVFLTGGLDWQGPEYRLGVLGGPTSGATDYLCIEMDEMAISLVQVFSKTLPTAVLLTTSLGDMRIRDGVRGSVFKYLLQGIGASQISLSCVEKKMNLTIQPMSMSVDQDTLEFINAFVRQTTLMGYSEVGLNEDDVSDAENDSLDDECSLEDEPLALPDGSETVFQSVQISAVSIEVNYKSKRVSMSKLRQGDPLQLLNLLPLLEGLKVEFAPVKLTDVVSVYQLAQRLTIAWSHDIDRLQVLRSLRSVKPIRSLTNLSKGVQELINQPLKQLKRGKQGHLSRGVLRGVSSFVKTLTIESLNLADVLVSSAQGTLEMIDNMLIFSEVPVDVADMDLVWEEEWATVERGAGRSDPASAIDGLRVGSDALRRGIGMARLGPSLVLKPAIGTAQAVSDVLRGTRATLDSGKERAETRRKFKEPWIGGPN